MDNHASSSTSPLLHSQLPVGYEACPQAESSPRRCGPRCTTKSVNDTVDRRVTNHEGSEENITSATYLDQSRVRIILRKVKRCRGLALTINAVLFFSFHSLFVDFMTTELNPFQITVMTFLVPLVGSLFLIVSTRLFHARELNVIFFHLLGGVCLFSAVCCLTFSFKYMPLGDAIALSYVSLIIVGVISWIFLREPLRLLDLLLAFIALAGVFCIARPSFIFGSNDEKPSHSNTLLEKPFHGNTLLGMAFGLAGAFTSSVLLVSVRKLSQLGEHPLVTSFINCLIVVLLNDVVCLAWGQWQQTDMTTWLWCLGAGTFFFVGQISLYIALSNESATLVNIICTVQIVLSFLLEFVFFHVIPSWTSAVGGGLIMLASVGAVTTRPVENDQQTSE